MTVDDEDSFESAMAEFGRTEVDQSLTNLTNSRLSTWDSNFFFLKIKASFTQKSEKNQTLHTVDAMLDSFSLSNSHAESWLRKYSHSRHQVGPEYRLKAKIWRDAVRDETYFNDPIKPFLLEWRHTLAWARGKLDELVDRGEFLKLQRLVRTIRLST